MTFIKVLLGFMALLLVIQSVLIVAAFRASGATKADLEQIKRENTKRNRRPSTRYEVPGR